MHSVQKSKRTGWELPKVFGGTMGLTMALQGLALAGGDTFGQLKARTLPDADVDGPISVPAPAVEEMRLSFKKRIPGQLQGQMMALCALARDVISNSQSGRRFTADPKNYLAEMGITGVTLDMDSREVKTVIALGDEEVREAVRNGDIKRYVLLMEAKGVFDANTLNSVFDVKKEVGVAAVSMVVVCITDVDIKSDTLALAATALDVSPVVLVSGLEKEKGALLNGISGKVTAMLWGKNAARDIIANYISDKAEVWASALSEMRSAKQGNISKEALKKAIEVKLTKAMTE